MQQRDDRSNARGAAREWVAAVALALLLPMAFVACAGSTGAPRSAATASPAAAPVAAPTPLPPTDWSEQVVYFVIVDRFADGDPSNDRNVDTSQKGTFHGGDFAGLRAHLDEIAQLGVTALWITPVVKQVDGFVTGAGFPDWAYHGYWADDFTRTDPRFGSEDELRALVAAAHAKGIRVLLDVVYNHAGYNTHFLRDPATKSWLRSPDTGGCGTDDLTSCISGLPDFRTELPYVAKQLMDWQLGMAKRTGVDGFRLDTVKHVDHPFWDEHRRRTRAELGPGFFLLGEVWGGDAQVLEPWFSTDELDAGFDFGFQGSTLGWVQGRGRTIAFDRYLAARDKVRAGHLLAQFLSSHDVPGALFQLGGDRQKFELAAALEMLTRGLPVVYYGEEVGRLGGDWPDNRSDMPWATDVKPGAFQKVDTDLYRFYTKLIALRRAHPALSRGVHQSISSEGDLLVYGRRDEASGETAVVAVNRGETPAQTSFALPAAWDGKAVQDAWSGEPATVADGKLTTTVAPRTFRVFVLSR